jgi:hypothetical protein
MAILLAAWVALAASSPSPSALERLLAAASDDAFYIVLEPASKRLSLRLREVVLLEGEVFGIDQGTRRVAFWPTSEDVPVIDRLWIGGHLLPARPDRRIEIVPGRSTAAAPTREPATCFAVGFDAGLVLEVRSAAGCPLRATLALRWLSARQLCWWPLDRARTRLRVVVDGGLARELHAAIGDGVRLVVLD